MIRYIDTYRVRFGVEPICRTLKATQCGFITARGYRVAKTRPVSARMVRDNALLGEIRRVYTADYSVYGVRKMYASMIRAGWLVGRDHVARLMRQAGLGGVTRSRKVFTTHPDASLARPVDLLQRQFTAPAPRRAWVADITYVATWSGFAYVGFVTDAYSRRIVGWSVSSTLRTEQSTLAAQNMPAWQVSDDLSGLICHNDHGANYLSVRYTSRVIELGAKLSTGSVSDAYDNALAETINGLYKAELIRRQGPWRTIEQVELATLSWVWWWNHQRLHEHLGYHTPIETEQAYYNQPTEPQLATANREKQ